MSCLSCFGRKSWRAPESHDWLVLQITIITGLHTSVVEIFCSTSWMFALQRLWASSRSGHEYLEKRGDIRHEGGSRVWVLPCVPCAVCSLVSPAHLLVQFAQQSFFIGHLSVEAMQLQIPVALHQQHLQQRDTFNDTDDNNKHGF